MGATSFRRTAASLFVLCLLILLLAGSAVATGRIVFTELSDYLQIENRALQVGVNRQNGGISFIKDNQTGALVTEGNTDSLLWWAFFSSGDWVESTSYEDTFSYEWDPISSQLTMFYPAQEAHGIAVKVIMEFSNNSWFKISAEVTNYERSPVQTFGLPYQLVVTGLDINHALLPLLPGVKLDGQFFVDRRSYTAVYPGVMFADFMAVSSQKGKMAIYGQQNGSVQPATLGFERRIGGDNYAIVHNYNTWIEPQQTWKSPSVYIRVGESYGESLAAFREDSGIADFPTLAEKLGDKTTQFYASPLYKLDVELIGQPFDLLKESVLHTIDIPGLVHPVAFQRGGHDVNYPDFLPPDRQWGTTAEFADFVNYAQEKGNLVMPYTNLSWWDTDGPTVANLPSEIAESDLTVLARNGTKNMESYGAGKNGYVMNLHNSFVQNRIKEEHRKLIQDLNMDGIFEDQWGARSAPYDFNPAGLGEFDPSTSYFQGVLAHAKANKAHNLMTEIGVDMLAEHEVGFMGTNFLWDKLGYRAATAPYSTYYPMAGMLLRDKVLLYQHDLAEETWTNDMEMFRWNLAFGYNFSNAFYIDGKLNTENPWLDLVGVFQKYALANYADQLIEDFEHIGDLVYKTRFSDFTAYTNWGELYTFTMNGHTIPPGGAMVVSDHGLVTVGVFKGYNNRLLSPGDHYILEHREQDHISVFHPVGEDTAISVQRHPEWGGATIKAYQYDGTLIGDVEGRADGDLITFDWKQSMQSQPVGYVELTERAIPNLSVADDYLPDLIVKQVITNPPQPAVGDQVTFEVIVENIGQHPTVEGIGCDVSLDINVNEFSFWSRGFTRSILPGEVVKIPLTEGSRGAVWLAASGDHVINAIVDDYNKIAESNERNNAYVTLLADIKDLAIRAEVSEPITKEMYALKTDLDLTNDNDLSRAFENHVYNKVQRVVVGSIDSASDANGQFGVLWDEQNLYFLGDVIDDMKSMSLAQSAWQNDSIELYLDMNNSGGSTYMRDDFQYMFSWNNHRPYETKHNAVSGVSTRSIDTDYGYKIFAIIPWDTLGVVPSGDMPFGIDVAINDNDTGTRNAQLIWNSYDDQAWQYPNRFGRGKLVADAKPDLKITRIAWTPEVVKVGDKMQFNVTLTNQGTAPTPDGIVHQVDFHINGSNQPFFWSDNFTSSILPGESVILTVNNGAGGSDWTLHNGTYTIMAIVDAPSRIDELEATNNSTIRVISLD